MRIIVITLTTITLLVVPLAGAETQPNYGDQTAYIVQHLPSDTTRLRSILRQPFCQGVNLFTGKRERCRVP